MMGSQMFGQTPEVTPCVYQPWHHIYINYEISHLLVVSRAISIKGLYAKMAKLSYIRQINRGNELLLLKESKVRLKVILSG